MSLTKVSSKRMIDYSESAFNIYTTDYTVQLQDASTIVAISGGNITEPTLSAIIPNNNFPQGFEINFVRIGATPVSITGATGVNLRTTGGSTRLAFPNSIASIVYSGIPAVGWLVFGDLV